MDHEEVNEIEEGEITEVSDSDNNYTPLERPANFSASSPRIPSTLNTNLPSESDEEPESSDTDSDSDSKLKKSKKPKIKLKLRARYSKPERKKYDIWSTRVQDEILAETLNSCDVTTKDRSRNVETYDYTLASKYYADLDRENGDTTGKWQDEEHRRSNKRTREDRRNTNFKPYKGYKRDSNKNEAERKAPKRIISDLSFDENSPAEDLAKDIANKLFEEKEDLILNVISIVGKEKAINIFNETKQIESKGGMLIMNQTRRRTPGGVFLFLVRHDFTISQDQKNQIFQEEREKTKQFHKNKQREKSRKIKQDIAAAKTKFLPDLLTRAELFANQNQTRKLRDQSEETEVINPPPTPETDGHGDENSGDGSETPIESIKSPIESTKTRSLTAYEDDFLDIGASTNMDLF